jgi:hypothetical protein
MLYPITEPSHIKRRYKKEYLLTDAPAINGSSGTLDDMLRNLGLSKDMQNNYHGHNGEVIRCMQISPIFRGAYPAEIDHYKTMIELRSEKETDVAIRLIEKLLASKYIVASTKREF